MTDVLCKSLAPRFPALLGGELEAEERAAFIDHLNRCSECAAEFGRLKKIWDALGKIPQIFPGPQFDLGLRNRIEQVRRKHGSSFRLFPARYAATLLIAVAGGTLTGNVLARGIREEMLRRQAPTYLLWEPLIVVDVDPLVEAYKASFTTTKENPGAK